MANQRISAKRIAIDKANTTVVIVVSLAAFIVVFSLVASKSLLTQRAYQAKVIDKKETARDQLEKNIEEAEKLTASYEEFANSPENALGGNPQGKGDKDGANPRIILDALPSKYDFPAVTASLDKLVSGNGFKLTSISGTDDEITQSALESSGNPAPIDMPFTLEAAVSSQDANRFMELFEKSIRPMIIQKISITGQDTQLKVTLNAKTFFQPEKTLSIKEEVVK